MGYGGVGVNGCPSPESQNINNFRFIAIFLQNISVLTRVRKREHS